MDGIIVINKPKGMTSHDVVYKVKKMLNIKKVGHTGTLDPNATGVLPLLLDNGTKLSKYLIEHDKEYEVCLQLGIKTDTLDSEGKVVKKELVNDVLLSSSNVTSVFNSFIGKQFQVPPMYSAIKVKGKKLYELARKGEKIEVEPREITIYDIKVNLIDMKNNEIFFTVKCSKGTYIRSLCNDIAVKLQTCGYMKELNRKQVGTFNIKEAITLEELEENKDNKEYLKEKIIGIEDFFKDNGEIVLDNKKLELFLNGVKINSENSDGLYNIYNKGKYIGIGKVYKNQLKREIVI